MIITSRMVRGRCPICGAANCTCGGPSNVVAIGDGVTVAEQGGPLVTVQLRPGVGVKMRESEAQAKGLIPPAAPPTVVKVRKAPANKKRKPGDNKGGRSSEEA